MRPFRRRGEELVARFEPAEARILALLLDQLSQLLDADEVADDPAEDEDQQLAVYYWLTCVQGSLVDALVAGRAGRR